jgi:hypothetical protein
MSATLEAEEKKKEESVFDVKTGKLNEKWLEDEYDQMATQARRDTFDFYHRLESHKSLGKQETLAFPRLRDASDERSAGYSQIKWAENVPVDTIIAKVPTVKPRHDRKPFVGDDVVNAADPKVQELVHFVRARLVQQNQNINALDKDNKLYARVWETVSPKEEYAEMWCILTSRPSVCSYVIQQLLVSTTAH